MQRRKERKQRNEPAYLDLPTWNFPLSRLILQGVATSCRRYWRARADHHLAFYQSGLVQRNDELVLLFSATLAAVFFGTSMWDRKSLGVSGKISQDSVGKEEGERRSSFACLCRRDETQGGGGVEGRRFCKFRQNVWRNPFIFSASWIHDDLRK